MANQSKVTRLSEAIRAVVTREDSIHSSPVNTLPDEILCMIFEWVKCAYLHSEESDDKDAPPHQVAFRKEVMWISVSHVCHCWRDIALANSTLWTSPPMLFPTWASVMLERSRSATIEVLDIDESLVNPEVITRATSYLPRAKSVNLHNYEYDEDLEEMIENLLATPNTILERLEASFKHDFKLCRHPEWDSFLIPIHVLANAKRLKTLDLYHIDIDWHPRPLSSLTELRLLNISYARRPTMAQLRLVLGDMPLLRILNLLEALPTQNFRMPVPDASEHKALLGRVEELVISGNSFDLRAFINNFATSSALAELGMMVIHENLEEQDEDLLEGCQVALTLTESCSVLSNVKRVTIEAYNVLTNTWKFQILPGVNPETRLEGEFMLEMSAFRLKPDFSLSQDGMEGIRFKQLFQTVNWNIVDRLDLNLRGNYHLDCLVSSTLATTFGALESIKEIVAVGWSAWLITSIFYGDGPVVGTDSDSDIGFPSHPFAGLERLHFKSVKFRKDGILAGHINSENDDIYVCKTIGCDHINCGDWHVLFEDMLEAFDLRKKALTLPATLILEDCCGLSRDDVDALRERVGEGTVVYQHGQEPEWFKDREKKA